MKKYVLFAFLLFCFFNAHAQDFTKEDEKLVLEKDSLQKVIKKIRDNNAHVNKSFIDSIASYNSKIDNLNSNIKELKKDTAYMNKQIKKCDPNHIKNLETKLQQLEETIKEKDGNIKSIKVECDNMQREKYQEGQQVVYNQIQQIYQLDSFDALISSSTQKSINRDLELVGNNQVAKKKLEDLKIYFTALQVLDEKYNEQKVRNAQGQISNITQSALVENLKDKLEKYKLCNDALQSTIATIIELDHEFIANNDDTQKIKLRDILFELAGYFRNYRFNFLDYPYLSEIVLEIMKVKQLDANSDLSPFLNKL